MSLENAERQNEMLSKEIEKANQLNNALTEDKNQLHTQLLIAQDKWKEWEQKAINNHREVSIKNIIVILPRT